MKKPKRQDGYYFVIESDWCKLKGKIVYPHAGMAEENGLFVARKLKSEASPHFEYRKCSMNVIVKPHYREDE